MKILEETSGRSPGEAWRRGRELGNEMGKPMGKRKNMGNLKMWKPMEYIDVYMWV
jgi:hypothetical protein